METFTREQVEEMVREAVEKTERSFGGTFKRLKAENEELLARIETDSEERGVEKTESERILAERDTLLAEKDRELAAREAVLAERGLRIQELAIGAELARQTAKAGPLPERLIDRASIVWSEDPDELRKSVAEAVERGRAEFESILGEAGIVRDGESRREPNPTNPAGRDGASGRDLRTASAREALTDMTKRGLLKSRQ